MMLKKNFAVVMRTVIKRIDCNPISSGRDGVVRGRVVGVTSLILFVPSLQSFIAASSKTSSSPLGRTGTTHLSLLIISSSLANACTGKSGSVVWLPWIEYNYKISRE